MLVDDFERHGGIVVDGSRRELDDLVGQFQQGMHPNSTALDLEFPTKHGM